MGKCIREVGECHHALNGDVDACAYCCNYASENVASVIVALRAQLRATQEALGELMVPECECYCGCDSKATTRRGAKVVCDTCAECLDEEAVAVKEVSP